jgi:hypothetical protein
MVNLCVLGDGFSCKRERDRERTRKVTSIILALSHDFLQVGNKVVISTALSLIEI